jgi:hypothetical protein
MPTTVKDLIEVLTKYSKPEDVIIYDYYTKDDFDFDENQPALTNEQFAEIADELASIRHSIWEGVYDQISDAIYTYQNKKGQE